MLCLGSIYRDHLGPCVLYWEGCYKTMRTDIFLESSSGRRHGLDSGLWFSRIDQAAVLSGNRWASGAQKEE